VIRNPEKSPIHFPASCREKVNPSAIVNIESAGRITVQLQTIDIPSTPWSVIFAHPPSRITYTVPIENGSSIAFAIGILPDAWEKIPQMKIAKLKRII